MSLRLVPTLVLALGLSACSSITAEQPDAQGAATHHASATPHADHPVASATPDTALRAGETLRTVRMPTRYTPSAPTGKGTDDYRCFLLDPRITHDSFLTGLNVLPGQPRVVHHVILFRVSASQVRTAEEKDAETPGEGWTCFGGSGLDGGIAIDSAPWLGAWAPGGGESVMAPDVGVPMEAGSRVIMQVHYNLLAGARPDRSAAVLRLAPGTKKLASLETMLLVAPVELPCRAGHTGRLCDRSAAVADGMKRFGEAGNVANALHLLCGADPIGPVQSCTRTVDKKMTIRAVAGHMHLLGRQIRIDLNPGTPRARTLLNIKVWDFDNQGSVPVRPARVRPGDTLKVTCHHDQSLRDVLPAFKDQPERYVVWGEGTTDEMCLGIVLFTRG